MLPSARLAFSSEIDRVQYAVSASRYMQRVLQGEPEFQDNILSTLHTPWTVEEMQCSLAATEIPDEATLKQALRRLRKQVMLRLLVRDLSGLADLPEVMATTTALAETALTTALHHLNTWLEAQFGVPIGSFSGKKQELLVIGMGKLGGGELNVSSDIDLIFAYPEDGATQGGRKLDNQEYFTRLGRQLIAAISELTADGFVFRVDMRLRPYGDSGPLAASFPMLEQYFETQGREWERYAWIKARVIAGAGGDELMGLMRPFVYRKYLDFGAFASMRDLHAQIRREVQKRELYNNIKLGPGGIREIEFAAQVFQLIRGGKLPELQIRPTLQVLDALRRLGLLPPEAVTELSAAYHFLRNLEHRLQYLDDKQTHALPNTPEDRDIIAHTMGFGGYPELEESLNSHRAKVTRHFEQIFAAPQSTQESHPLATLWSDLPDDGKAVSTLVQLGYTGAAEIWERLKQIKLGSRYNHLPASSRTRFDALIPPLIEVASHSHHPDQTLERILHLMENIARREPYLALLLEYPQTLTRLAHICDASPWAAEYLAQHPILLDELLDTRLLYSEPDWPSLKTRLQTQLSNTAGDIERQMDTLRHFKHAETFHLLAQDLAGLLPLERLSDHLSDLAELILGQVLALAWAQLGSGTPAFAIIAYGKLGSREMSYSSDTDIVFLYRGENADSPEIFFRLAQRINRWLVTPTAAGVLYETDFRLRPNGEAGLLVSSVDAFRAYQIKNAWTWEHQALTRARFCSGDEGIGAAFEQIRREILMQTRDRTKLCGEITAMRQKMLDAHAHSSGLFDVKHDRGGIIDVEFIVQFLVLGHAHDCPDILINGGNIRLLGIAAKFALIPDDLASQAIEAYRQYRLWLHAFRLQGDEKVRVELAVAQSHIESVRQLWQTVFAPCLGGDKSPQAPQ